LPSTCTTCTPMFTVWLFICLMSRPLTFLRGPRLGKPWCAITPPLWLGGVISTEMPNLNTQLQPLWPQQQRPCTATACCADHTIPGFSRNRCVEQIQKGVAPPKKGNGATGCRSKQSCHIGNCGAHVLCATLRGRALLSASFAYPRCRGHMLWGPQNYLPTPHPYHSCAPHF
jgi:hypothetical protein